MIPLLLGLAGAAATAGGLYIAKKVRDGEAKVAEIETAARQVASGTETSAKLSAVAATAAITGVVLLALLTLDDGDRRRRR